MRAIIPCAGYGTRMGMKPDQSKELIDYSGDPLILWTLRKCMVHGWNPLVILRKEKQDLIDFCNERRIETLVIEPKGEWPDTILASRMYWEEDNIVILPDTIFDTNLEQFLKPEPLVIGLHKVDDVSKWGQVTDYLIVEKPDSSESGNAWGLISFNREFGDDLFERLSKRKLYYLPKGTRFVNLLSFKDVTRG